MKNKLLIIISLLFFVTSCAGMGGKRSDKSDEFLVEKKNPLVMPPDIDDLPKPDKNTEVLENNNNFEETLKSQSPETQNSSPETSGTLQESIMKKIEQ